MENKTRVYLSGTFDCFHSGFVDLLRHAREVADFVVVGVHSDAYAESCGARPVMGEHERLAIIRACRDVDLAFVVESRTAQRQHLELLRPDFILHGDDVMGDALLGYLGITDEFLRELRIRVRYAPCVPGISTDEVKQRVLKEYRSAVEHEVELAAVTVAV